MASIFCIRVRSVYISEKWFVDSLLLNELIPQNRYRNLPSFLNFSTFPMLYALLLILEFEDRVAVHCLSLFNLFLSGPRLVWTTLIFHISLQRNAYARLGYRWFFFSFNYPVRITAKLLRRKIMWCLLFCSPRKESKATTKSPRAAVLIYFPSLDMHSHSHCQAIIVFLFFFNCLH